MGEKQIIYMDHSATTYYSKEIVDAMIPYYTEHFGNPSSVYSVAEALEGLPPIKMHCSVLAEDGIHQAISDYRKKQGLEPWGEKIPTYTNTAKISHAISRQHHMH